MRTWEDLAFQIYGIVNEHGALKGITYLTNDGFRPGGRELAVRCDQFLCFNSVARSHNHKPWQSSGGGDDLSERMAIGKERERETEEERSAAELLGLDRPDPVQEEIIRKFLKLRYRLLPYLYSAARECFDTGLPVTRPFMAAFEADKNCCENQYPMQYMFGKDILVCPVWHAGNAMEVYLPEGCDWVNFFTGECFGGGQKIVADVSDLSVFPVFVKSGAVIPMRTEKNWIDGEEEDLILKIFGEGAGECDLYEDDGVSLGYRRGEYAVTKIFSRSSGAGVEINVLPAVGNYKGMLPERSIALEWRGKTIRVRQKKGERIKITL